MDKLGLLSVRPDLIDLAVSPGDHSDEVPGQAKGSEALEGKAIVREASHSACQECPDWMLRLPQLWHKQNGDRAVSGLSR